MLKVYKIFTIFALVLAIVTSMVSYAENTYESSAKTMEDIVGTEYEKPVNVLNAIGIMKGYEDGKFMPDNTITRKEFAAVIVRFLGLESTAQSIKGESAFNDVNESDWAIGYIKLNYEMGIINGYGDNFV